MSQRVNKELRKTITDALAANISVAEICEAYGLKSQQVYAVRYSLKKGSADAAPVTKVKRKYRRRASKQSSVSIVAEERESDIDYKELYFKAVDLLVRNGLVEISL